MQENADSTILNVTGLKTYFPVRGGLLSPKRWVRAVDGVDIAVHRGRTLGLVGESGSGKTTVGRTIIRLVPATAGEVVFGGQDVFACRGASLRALRGRITMIFQDPYGSLNPRMTIGNIVAEPLKVHRIVPRRRRRRRVGELLERVGLSPAYVSRYPHEFSGGQRQRIGIARALASEPDFIICDEPISALDDSIQAQILNLLSDLQDDLGLSYLLIAHNLAVVEHFADDVAVMYLGRIVERAGRDALYANPIHPYTESLLSAVPKIAADEADSRIRLPGEMPSPITPPAGCPFHPRCPLTRALATELPDSQTAPIAAGGEEIRIVGRCASEEPTLRAVRDDAGHCHACLLRHDGPEAGAIGA